ncbi:MAG TPA: protein kinase [Victivallales bacterium]|nr:protein kinase [Victivallales bacterium]
MENIKNNIPNPPFHENINDSSAQTVQITKHLEKDITLEKIAHYRLLKIIGFGGSGVIYEAEDEDGSPLALKLMHIEPSTPKDEIYRFIREIETAKKLRQHPNIITIYDAGYENRNYYIAMELVKDAKTLSNLKYKEKNNPTTINEILTYAIDIADALSYAHKNGVIHRDIKPTNILINEFGKAKLSDFGIAKNENAPKITITGAIMGTPYYMAPEQCGFGDKTTTKQSDIYSFGVTLYEIITGEMPYPVREYEDIIEIFRVICTEEPRSPRLYRKDISRNLEAVLLRMLDKEKQLRYKSIENVKNDLIACRDGKPVSVRKLSIAEKFEKWIRMNVKTVIIILCGISTLLFIYFVIVLPEIRKYMYQKSKADLNTVAAKRRILELESELNVLKGKNEENETSGEKLKNARNLLTQEKFEDAQKLFELLLTEAIKSSNRGMTFECASWLGRIAMKRENYIKAVEYFNIAMLSSEKDSPLFDLANFEKAIALYKQGKFSEAASIFAKIARENRKLEKSKYPDNITKLSQTMFSIIKNENEKENLQLEIENLSPLFKGLGLWIKAHNEKD